MQCLCLHLTVRVMLYAEKGGWVAEQEAAFVLLVVVVGVRRGKKGLF